MILLAGFHEPTTQPVKEGSTLLPAASRRKFALFSAKSCRNQPGRAEKFRGCVRLYGTTLLTMINIVLITAISFAMASQ
jgi:hypothetical protein